MLSQYSKLGYSEMGCTLRHAAPEAQPARRSRPTLSTNVGPAQARPARSRSHAGPSRRGPEENAVICKQVRVGRATHRPNRSLGVRTALSETDQLLRELGPH